ncbi:hypothetical protein EOM60_03760 [Candidatus Saccharibacteria bacterium]|nr:hypothetical protein [Candidatus Saccharibacteria bacterium]
MFIAILGRQPEISVAELEAVFGKQNVAAYRNIATVNTASLDINRLGGTIKSGEIIQRLSAIDAQKNNFRLVSDYIIKHYHELWKNSDNKITLGISAYQLNISPRDIQKIGLQLKILLKKDEVSLRLIPNDQSTLSTATSHNNRLGLSSNKVELIIAKTSPIEIVIAESRGAQNITAYTRRDHEKPYRDAFIGMLPPKLAQIMINLAHVENGFILDPFCGTGTVLQEALLLGYDTYGTDFSTKMIDYSTKNLTWLKQKYPRLAEHKIRLEEADAIDHKWDNPHQISAVVSEVYLGQPFSAPPSPEKLEQVRRQCNHITSSFLENIRPQLASSTILCLAVPAWLNKDGSFTYLPLVRNLEKLGYQLADHRPLLYHRENQVVARQLLVLSIK